MNGPVGPRAILSRPNPSTNLASVVKEELFFALCVSCGGARSLIAGSGAIARADTEFSLNCQRSKHEPRCRRWTSHLILTTRTRHEGGIGRFAGGILARTSKIAQELTRSALRFLGTPYVFGGTSITGFDCSGYVQHVFAMLGMHLPRTADAQYDVGRPAVGGPRPGDLVFFETYTAGVSHVGIYLGHGEFVHAS